MNDYLTNVFYHAGLLDIHIIGIIYSLVVLFVVTSVWDYSNLTWLKAGAGVLRRLSDHSTCLYLCWTVCQYRTDEEPPLVIGLNM